MAKTGKTSIQPFNSPFETGVRSLCVLASDMDMELDLQQLSAFDYLVVHTGDFEAAPSSLHPENPTRNGELVIRRELVARGLSLMEAKGLVLKTMRPNGFFYKSTEIGEVFMNSLTTPYIVALRERAIWTVKNYNAFGENAFPIVFNKAFDRWSADFHFEQIAISTR